MLQTVIAMKIQALSAQFISILTSNPWNGIIAIALAIILMITIGKGSE